MGESFTNLEIYQLSRELTTNGYQFIKKLPPEEKYSMGAQLRRALLSVGANIAEGYGRFHFKDKIKFMYNARGSLFESKHFFIAGNDIGYFSNEETQAAIRKIDRLGVKLNNYISSLYRRNKSVK